ncbi:hypothetical protein H0H81_000466 [Sphagnurus paluster]|uniref:Phosphatidylinositol transfer protein SFH5 n=1 Tax=Sphagnurus paluster TaxID=117069 RepID=A0A9P7FQ72_9AGAR|nr:hypothetical protein H0H81_000466 [Sphagnurus paluster]
MAEKKANIPLSVDTPSVVNATSITPMVNDLKLSENPLVPVENAKTTASAESSLANIQEKVVTPVAAPGSTATTPSASTPAPPVSKSATGSPIVASSATNQAERVSGASPPTVPPGAATKGEEFHDIEPQNTLTNRFTQAEWEALRKFRSELPDIFAEGFPDDPKARDKPISFWGVLIDPNHPLDARVSVILMKFLRARNLSVSSARDMLVSTLRWRTSINIDAVMKEEFPQDVFGSVGHIYGRDKENRPVVYNIYGGNNLSEVFSDVQRFIRWRVALQEKSVAMLDFNEIDQAIQIHDYLGVSLTSRDTKSKAAAAEATNIFQSHYPELLYKKFFVNVPTLMNWIFWAFKPILPAATLAKMTVVGTGHHALKKALAPFIASTELPKQYGGDALGWK